MDSIYDRQEKLTRGQDHLITFLWVTTKPVIVQLKKSDHGGFHSTLSKVLNSVFRLFVIRYDQRILTSGRGGSHSQVGTSIFRFWKTITV